MIRITEIKLPIEQADTLKHQDDQIKAAILKRLAIAETDLRSFTIFKRGVDARKSHAILYVYSLDVEVNNEARLLAKYQHDQHVNVAPDTGYHFVAQNNLASKQRPIIVGFGPAGIFAALILAQSGFNPIVVERGKEVRKRTQDTWALWRKNTLHPESNVQFGEGGAGTFSDGKLYSQIKDPKHYGRKVIQEFIKAGAPEEIQYVSHPHIGTFKLVGVVEKMRQTIIDLGGEIRFESRVDDIHIVNGQVQGVTLQTGEHIQTNHLVLAVGHSARDTFEMIHNKGILSKPSLFLSALE